MAQKTTNSEPMLQEQPVAITQDQQLQHQQEPKPSTYSGPGVVQKSTWSNSIWDCFSPGQLCLKATFCPCFVYGKTQHRLNRDPHLMGYERFNNDCLLWAGAQWCGIGVLFTFLQRRQIREKYAIGGESDLSDIGLSWCCHCCSLIQQEKEVIRRTQGGENMEQGYQRPEPMVVA
ncbi:hypothetical protein DSL72_000656 [Monilinia vaccinii-corymbosi]|uniref:DUF614 domain protein n=1 Tax=Monilinia vaccinii-corymbosi TaxID=61207 RepID=A0A8A3NZL2_9HELO|nr:hypothetical protein DSL72_000656 [Monilinia vaccinii-corymbosi]